MIYALITGASKGIGRAMAEELAARKVNLLLVARSEALLQEVATDLSGRYAVKTAFLAIDLSANEAAGDVFNWVRGKTATR